MNANATHWRKILFFGLWFCWPNPIAYAGLFSDSWENAGIQEQEAIEWKSCGKKVDGEEYFFIPDADCQHQNAAICWKNEGLSPSDACQYWKADIPVWMAGKFKDADIPGNDYKMFLSSSRVDEKKLSSWLKWKKKGYSLHHFYQWCEVWKDDMDGALQWQELGFSPRKAAALAARDVNPAAAEKWLTAGGTIQEFDGQSKTPQEVKEEKQNLYDWKMRGYTKSEQLKLKEFFKSVEDVDSFTKVHCQKGFARSSEFWIMDQLPFSLPPENPANAESGQCYLVQIPLVQRLDENRTIYGLTNASPIPMYYIDFEKEPISVPALYAIVKVEGSFRHEPSNFPRIIPKLRILAKAKSPLIFADR